MSKLHVIVSGMYTLSEYLHIMVLYLRHDWQWWHCSYNNGVGGDNDNDDEDNGGNRMGDNSTDVPCCLFSLLIFFRFCSTSSFSCLVILWLDGFPFFSAAKSVLFKRCPGEKTSQTNQLSVDERQSDTCWLHPLWNTSVSSSDDRDGISHH